MKKQSLVKSIIIAVLIPAAAMLLRLMFHYSSISNIIINIKSAPMSEFFPVLAQTLISISVLIIYLIQNRRAAFCICVVTAAVSVAITPITALMCLPVLFGFYLERNKAYSFGEKGDSGAAILFIVLNAIVSAFLFSARYFSYDSSLSFLAENIVREISYPFIIAEVILAAVLIILAVRVRGKENISRRNTALTAIIVVSLIQSLIVTFIAINRISDVEYVTVMGYVVLIVLILYRLFKKEK